MTPYDPDPLAVDEEPWTPPVDAPMPREVSRLVVLVAVAAMLLAVLYLGGRS